MREKANKKCEVFIRTVEFFIYARYSARCLARAPAVDMDLKVETLLKMQVQLKLCMNLESTGGGDGAFAGKSGHGFGIELADGYETKRYIL